MTTLNPFCRLIAMHMAMSQLVKQIKVADVAMRRDPQGLSKNPNLDNFLAELKELSSRPEREILNLANRNIGPPLLVALRTSRPAQKAKPWKATLRRIASRT